MTTRVILTRARFYDPLVGQFIQPDTIVPDPLNPLAWNRFGYVYNNAVNYTDPSGHFACGGVCIGIIGGALIGGAVGASYAYSEGYSPSSSEFWWYTATGAVIGGATGGLLGVGAGIVGTATRAAWATAYSNSPLFAWWAGGGANIIRTWGTRSLMGRIGGGLGLLGRVPFTPFAGAQISVNFANAIPGALGRATLRAFATNAFLKDATISLAIYGIGTAGVDVWNGKFPGSSLSWSGASTAILTSGLGGMANAAIPTSWRILARSMGYFSVNSITAGAAYVTTSYLNNSPIVSTTLGEAMLLGGIVSPTNFISRSRIYYPSSGAGGLGAFLASYATPF